MLQKRKGKNIGKMMKIFKKEKQIAQRLLNYWNHLKEILMKSEEI